MREVSIYYIGRKDCSMEKCKELLAQELSDGEWHDAEEVRALMKGAGINKSDFRQARREMGIMTRNNGDGTWSWRLSDE